MRQLGVILVAILLIATFTLTENTVVLADEVTKTTVVFEEAIPVSSEVVQVATMEKAMQMKAGGSLVSGYNYLAEYVADLTPQEAFASTAAMTDKTLITSSRNSGTIHLERNPEMATGDMFVKKKAEIAINTDTLLATTKCYIQENGMNAKVQKNTDTVEKEVNSLPDIVAGLVIVDHCQKANNNNCFEIYRLMAAC